MKSDKKKDLFSQPGGMSTAMSTILAILALAVIIGIMWLISMGFNKIQDWMGTVTLRDVGFFAAGVLLTIISTTVIPRLFARKSKHNEGSN